MVIPAKSRLEKVVIEQLILVLRRTKDINEAARFCGIKRTVLVKWLRTIPGLLDACPDVKKQLRTRRRYFGQYNRPHKISPWTREIPFRKYNILNDYGDHDPKKFPPDKS